MADIFISYASEDLERVKPLVSAIEEKGWTVWWDRELVAGPCFDEEIEKAIEEASCVLVAWSKQAIKSGWVRDEANEGLARGILLPVCLDDVHPPMGFRSIQRANLFNWPNEYGECDMMYSGIEKLIQPSRNTDDSTLKNSIAVLPFANMSSDPEQEYFSDGMAEEIINGLVSFPDLKVIARTSSFQFKGENRDIREIGASLNVSHILEGSVRKAGTSIRVTAQLILVRDGMHLWSNRFDRELADVFIVQDEITSEILKSLRGHLGTIDKQPIRTVNPEGYSAYLQGRNSFNRMQIDDAIRSFERSVDLDPQNADAFANLASIFSIRVFTGLTPKEEVLPLIEEYTTKGLSFNPNQPTLLAIRAQESYFVDRDYQQAIDILTRLVIERPNDSEILPYLAEVFAPLRRLDLSLVILRHWVELDPLNSGAHFLLGSFAAHAGEFDQARQSFENCESLGGDATLGRLELASGMGDTQALRNLLDQWQPGVGSNFRPIFEALLSALEGDLDHVKKVLETTKNSSEHQSFYFKSNVALLEGEIGLALDYYEMAMSSAEAIALRYIHGNPISRTTRPEFFTHPRYDQMLVNFGLDKKSISALRIPPLPF
jgi:TolB-like protein